MTAQIKEFVKIWQGEFTNSMIFQEFDLKTASQKASGRKVLDRLVKEGLLKRIEEKTATYERASVEFEPIDIDEAETDPFPLPLPFGLSNYVKVLAGSVIVISGTTNAGKTAFAFQCVEAYIRQSVTSFLGTPPPESAFALPRGGVECENGRPAASRLVRYMNSEMSPGELKARITAMGPESAKLLRDHVEWGNRTHGWEQVIVPDIVNVIDYLQIYDDFYRIGDHLSRIQNALKRGIAIVLIQKKTGEANPRGGEFALERCRLAINLDHNPSSGGGICTLRKVKAPVDYLKNPQGMELDYRLGPNMRLEAVSKLAFVDRKQRANINRRYEEERKRQEAVEDFFQVDSRKDEDKEIPF